MTELSAPMMIGSVPAKRLHVNVGIAPNGQIASINNAASDNCKISVVPGKWAYVEKTNPSTGTVTIVEFVLGPFGWDYERLPTS